MMRFLAALVLLISNAASAGTISIPFPGPGSGPYGATATLTYQTAAASAFSTSTPSFASLTIGTADPTRVVIVGLGFSKSSGSWGANPISSVTIGGVSATQVGSQVLTPVGVDTVVSFYIAAVPTGTTATVAVTLAANTQRGFVSVWSATNLMSSTPTATNSATGTSSGPSASLTIPSLGFGLGFVMGRGASNTWTNLTERNDQAVGADTASGADSTTAGTPTISTTTNSQSDSAMVLAAWH